LTLGETLFKVMTKHVMEKHPDVAEEIKKMHEKDPKKRGRETKPKMGCGSRGLIPRSIVPC
jgi:hypothetical protein